MTVAQHLSWAILAVIVLLIPLPLQSADDSISGNKAEWQTRLNRSPLKNRQVLLAFKTPGSPAVLYGFEKKEGGWVPALGPFEASIGKNGFAPPGLKKEGDGKTPSGRFSLGTAFGYAESIPTRMPYRQATPSDVWIDDPQADDYNRCTQRNATQARSYEDMRRPDGLYRYGLVIEYNTNPVVKDRGSAIFIHVRRDQGAPTAGCIALSEKDILQVLGWLQPSADPLIIMGDQTTLEKELLP